MCVAAVTTALFQRLRQPVVLGYLLAGMLVGPHLPVPLFADEAAARDLSELGVVLLMFSLGLEFSLRKLAARRADRRRRGGHRMQPDGLARLPGRARVRLDALRERCSAARRIAISSTTIIVKAFAEQKVAPARAEIVFGILVVEDLIAILLLASLTAVGLGRAARRRWRWRAPSAGWRASWSCCWRWGC